MSFSGFLKQSTAIDILLGPFVDATDGFTAETGLTLVVDVSKNGQALAAKNESTTPVHDAAGTVDGYYNTMLDATDTGTVGQLVVTSHNSSARPVRDVYQVLEEVVYDQFFKDGAIGLAAIGGSSGGSVSVAATSDNTSAAIIDSVTKVWATASGTFANIANDDGTTHDFTDTTNVIDHVYGFAVGGGRQATSVSILANVDGNSDEILLKVFDHVGSDWETIGTMEGSGGTSFLPIEAALFAKHTGTGTELGNVYIRIDTDSTTPSDISIKTLVVQAVSIGQSVGYSNGRIFINTAVSNTNTESFVDGVADNPVSTIGAAKTISTAVVLGDFHVTNGSSFTLGESTDNESYFGDNWTLALGGQSCAGAHFVGAEVTGTQTGSGCGFHDGEMGTVTLADDAHMGEMGLSGTITLPAGSVEFFNCHHDGDSLPVLDFGDAVGSTTVHMHAFHGGFEVQNMGDSGTDIIHLDGDGRLDVNANCTGGTINVRGSWDINDSSGAVTINLDDISANVVADLNSTHR